MAYYVPGVFTKLTLARAEAINSELAAIVTAFNKIPEELLLKRDMATYATDSGAADAYIVTLPSSPVAHTLGMSVRFKTANSNTGASTINVNALGAKAIKRFDGSALSAGDILAGGIVTLDYDGADFRQRGNFTADTGTIINIADNSVTNAKMADNAIDTIEIVDLAVTLGKLSAAVQAIINDALLGANNLSDVDSAASARTNLDVFEDVFTTRGDLLRGGVAGAEERVALGASGRVLASDGTDAAWTDPLTLSVAVPRSHLAGLGLANNGTDAEHDIDVAVGTARGGTNAANLMLASALTKRIDASWAVGTNQGGLDGTESVAGTPDASTWYHVWLIRRSDTGVVDALFSESATAPTMPTNYDQNRRIGSVRTNVSANIIAFSQLGDEFLRGTWATDIDDTDIGTARVLGTLASVPSGVKVIARLNVTLAQPSTDGSVRVSSPDQTDEATATPGSTISSPGAGHIKPATIDVRTNTSAQIAYRGAGGDTATNFKAFVYGWIDRRGRDD